MALNHVISQIAHLPDVSGSLKEHKKIETKYARWFNEKGMRGEEIAKIIYGGQFHEGDDFSLVYIIGRNTNMSRIYVSDTGAMKVSERGLIKRGNIIRVNEDLVNYMPLDSNPHF